MLVSFHLGMPSIPKYGSFKAAVNHERGKDPVYKTNKTEL